MTIPRAIYPGIKDKVRKPRQRLTRRQREFHADALKELHAQRLAALEAEQSPPRAPKNVEPNTYWLGRDERPDQTELPVNS